MRGAQKTVKLWHRVEWLPGYLIYRHKKDITTVQKAILALKLKLNKEKPEDEKLDFAVIETTRFTLIKEADVDKLLELLPKNKDFKKAIDQFPEKTLAKLAYELDTKRSNNNNNKITEALTEIRTNPLYQQSIKFLLEKYEIESLSTKKRKAVVFSARALPKPFHYFGNSMNYMENTLKILEVSESFSQASTIRDITCGSCSLTFYLASKYPNKKYIASDINGEIINALNYIKQTNMAEIKSTYTLYHNMVFDLPSAKQEEKYKELVEKYNGSDPKDYCLLIFLQNNAFTNVVFHENGLISASLKRVKVPKVLYWLNHIEECKSILASSDIEFKKLDMHEAIVDAKNGEFYFMTPPHENDQDRLYVHYIKKSELVASLNSMSKNKIPYLITYGDNTTKASSDLREEVFLQRFSYIIPGGMEKKPKKLSIYISSEVVANPENLNLLVKYFATLAEKSKKSSMKNLTELKKQERSSEIEISLSLEELTQQLATEILTDCGYPPDPNLTSTTLSKTQPMELEFDNGHQDPNQSGNLTPLSVKEFLPQTFFGMKDQAQLQDVSHGRKRKYESNLPSFALDMN